MKKQTSLLKLTVSNSLYLSLQEVSALYGLEKNELAVLILESYFDESKKEVLEMYKKIAAI